MIEAVIFDRDGVLADFKVFEAALYFGNLLPFNLDELSDRWEAWGNKVGFPRSVDEEKFFFKGLWDDICDELVLPDETRQSLHHFDYTQYMSAYSDTLQAMSYARQQGLKVGVLSNFALASLDASLEAIGLIDLVDCACAATVIGFSKPAPESYLAVCKKLNVRPESCLFLDDEIPCVEGAREVGMTAYQVDRSLEESRIDLGIVNGLDALPKLLKDYPQED